MVNQQLRDYVSEQLRLGVAKEAVRGALIESGWAQADVNEVMQSGTVAASPAFAPVAAVKPAAQPAVSAIPAIQKPASVAQPAAQGAAPFSAFQKPAGAGQMGGTQSAAPAGAAQPARMSQPAVSFAKPAQSNASQTADIVQPKVNPFPVSPKANAETPGTKLASVSSLSTSATKPMSLGASVGAKPAERGKLPMIAMTVLALLLGSAVAYFYMQTSDLQVRIASVSAESETARTQVGALAKERDSLVSQAASLSSENADLAVNLSFFVSPGGASGEQAVAFSGTLAGPGDKGVYTIKTSKGVIVIVKNSRDALVDKALKPLAGTTVQVSGTHIGGSREVTVLTVNGASVQPPAPASSTPTSSSSSAPQP